MKCYGCSFYVISKCFGNYCRCDESVRPCVAKHRDKANKRRKKKYSKNYDRTHKKIISI